MLIEIREIYRGNPFLAQYIRELQYRGKLKRYVNENNVACFDDDEYFEYKKKAKVGRPLKENNKKGAKNEQN